MAEGLENRVKWRPSGGAGCQRLCKGVWAGQGPREATAGTRPSVSCEEAPTGRSPISAALSGQARHPSVSLPETQHLCSSWTHAPWEQPGWEQWGSQDPVQMPGRRERHRNTGGTWHLPKSRLGGVRRGRDLWVPTLAQIPKMGPSFHGAPSPATRRPSKEPGPSRIQTPSWLSTAVRRRATALAQPVNSRGCASWARSLPGPGGHRAHPHAACSGYTRTRLCRTSGMDNLDEGFVDTCSVLG